MPRMTKEDFEAYQARRGQHAARPVLAALVSEDPDAGRFTATDDLKDAVAAGQELELHNEIIKECRRRGWNQYVHSNPVKKATNQPGTPDFIIPADAGRTLWIECKTVKGALSKDQRKFRDGLVARGHEFYVVRSLRRFIQIADKVFI